MGDRALIVNAPPHHSPVNTMNFGSTSWSPGNTMSASFGSVSRSPGNTMSSSANFKSMNMQGENGSFSAMEQQMYQAESKSEFSTMSTSGGGTTYHTQSLNRFPQNATAEIRQLDANQNHVPKISSIDTQRSSMDTQSLRRIKSETTMVNETVNDTSMEDSGGRTTVHITGPPQSMIVSECAVAEMKGRGGTQSMTSEVKRRGTEQITTTSEQKTTLSEGGKCTCCPYGYHIDLGFVQYCENMSDGAYLKKLKRIQREKRKLRKSMEVFLHQQEEAKTTQEYYTQPETVSVQATAFLKDVEQQNNVTNKVLDEIDSSVDHTLHSIDSMMYTAKSSRMFSESDETSASSSPGTTVKFNTFPLKRGRDIQEDIAIYNNSFEKSGRTDSQSSLSSISTVASERSSPYTPYNYTTTSHSVTSETISKITHITSDQLAATMATHLPTEDGAASPQSSTTTINKNSLTAIREAMAVSLQRLKELEEQVKALPVLQVRISVLKEEKRLLALQQKAKEVKNTRTIGVGDYNVNEVPSPATPSRFDFRVKSPPVAPKPKVRLVGVGDHSVIEPYLLQPDLPTGYTIRDNETSTDSQFYQRDTYVIERDRTQSALYSPFSKTPKPQTRTIGIGEGNVFDDASMRIHEKELRTVIIGQNQGVGKRNVGVDCRVATRDVGMMYSADDEKPSTRTVGVNVDTGAFMSSLNFKAEEMRSALKEVLSKSVRSIGTSCEMQVEKRSTGVQYSSSFTRSIGVGEDDIDIIIKKPVHMKSIGIDVCPLSINKSVNTDYGWKLDQSTNTMQLFMENKSCSTERVRQGTVSTMTEDSRMVSDKTQTDLKVFQALEVVKNQGTNPRKQHQKNTGMNTEVKELVDEDFGLRVTYKYRGLNAFDATTNTDAARKHDMSVNTERKKLRDVAVSEDTVDSFVCNFEEEVQERMEEETVEEVIYREQDEIIEKEWTEKTRKRTVEEVEGPIEESEVKTIMVREVPTSTQVVRQIVAPTGKVIISSPGKKTGADDMVEKKITSKGGSYTLQTITRKSVSDDEDEENAGQTTTTISTTGSGLRSGGDSSGGPEVTTSSLTKQKLVDDTEFHSNVKSTQERALRLKAKMDKLHGDTDTTSSKTTIHSSSGGYLDYLDNKKKSGDRFGSGEYLVNTSSRTHGLGSDENLNDSGSSFTSSTTSYRLDGGGSGTSDGGYKIITASSSKTSSSGSDGQLGGGNKMISSISSRSSGSDGQSGGGSIMISSSSSRSSGSDGQSEGGYKTISSSSSRSSGSDGQSGGGSIMISSSSSQSSSSDGQSGGGYTMVSSSSSGGSGISGSNDKSGGGYKIMKSSSSSSRGSGLSGSDEHLGTSLSSSQTSESSSDQGLGTSSSSDEVTTITQIYTLEDYYGGGKSYYEKYVKSKDGGVKVLERRPTGEDSDAIDSGSLKSCIKTTKSEKKAKKGIRFAENVVGGYTSSSTDSDDDDDGSDSGSASYDEGSYDGREGSIVYQCKDDEAIAKGRPGAQMFDQNIRETFELSRGMRNSCETLSKYLEDSTEVQTKELNASLEIIKEEWFKISSGKLSEPYQVEDFMSSFNEISRRLLEYIVNIQDSNGNTALHYAVSHCNFEVVSLLLDTGIVDLNKQNKAGYTSTMLATLAYTQTDRQREVVQRLFSMTDTNAKASKDGQTALMLAVSQGRTEMVNMLIDSGADINVQDDEGSTALMCACEHGHTDIVKILLAHPDCDSTLSDNDGCTALSIAMEAGHKDIGVILYAHVNFKSQSSPAIVKKRRTSGNTSPLPSPTIR
ncbi:Hypothetical predicted protein [Mytilus galloprovincialis]|uniref:KN motif and ankyrin repeat domain-containing protein 1 n=3 Tax=Mytilus galloprovincialis TaxID=29158 RepID=A0A8B6BFG0_MYTGA|nr:Hypothetical predicted protein [Mytilus galloprovincialis]